MADFRVLYLLVFVVGVLEFTLALFEVGLLLAPLLVRQTAGLDLALVVILLVDILEVKHIHDGLI